MLRTLFTETSNLIVSFIITVPSILCYVHTVVPNTLGQIIKRGVALSGGKVILIVVGIQADIWDMSKCP